VRTEDRAHPTDEAIARCVHEVHRAYNAFLQDEGPLKDPWDSLAAWDKETVILGVKRIRMGMGPETIHHEWVDRMVMEGWTWGRERDPEGKTHPSILPWNELPVWERRKAIVFCRIVYAFTIEEW
jgi:RyR domain